MNLLTPSTFQFWESAEAIFQVSFHTNRPIFVVSAVNGDVKYRKGMYNMLPFILQWQRGDGMQQFLYVKRTLQKKGVDNIFFIVNNRVVMRLTS